MGGEEVGWRFKAFSSRTSYLEKDPPVQAACEGVPHVELIRQLNCAVQVVNVCVNVSSTPSPSFPCTRLATLDRAQSCGKKVVNYSTPTVRGENNNRDSLPFPSLPFPQPTYP